MVDGAVGKFAAMKPAAADRSQLLERLFASLDSDPEVEEAWNAKRIAGKPRLNPALWYRYLATKP